MRLFSQLSEFAKLLLLRRDAQVSFGTYAAILMRFRSMGVTIISLFGQCILLLHALLLFFTMRSLSFACSVHNGRYLIGSCVYRSPLSLVDQTILAPRGCNVVLLIPAQLRFHLSQLFKLHDFPYRYSFFHDQQHHWSRQNAESLHHHSCHIFHPHPLFQFASNYICRVEYNVLYFFWNASAWCSGIPCCKRCPHIRTYNASIFSGGYMPKSEAFPC